jgi:8-oxo-dGTP pyrophosphatase MutT (NUDIX family)
VSEEPRGHYRVFSVREIYYRSPRSHRTHNFYVIDSPHWVNVIPVTPAGEVVMVRQFRYGIERITLEVPGGMVDAGESPAEAAARELLEETGYRSGPLVSLGKISPNPAIQSNTCYSFLAPQAWLAEPPTPDGTEEIDVVLVPRADIPRLVAEGVIEHSLVVVALYAWELYEQGLVPGEGGE